MKAIGAAAAPHKGSVTRCPILGGAVIDLADVAVAFLPDGRRVLGLPAPSAAVHALLQAPGREAGTAAGPRIAVTPCAADPAAMQVARRLAGPSGRPGAVWAAFACGQPGGPGDLAVLRLQPGQRAEAARERLGHVWPVLRRSWDGAAAGPADDADALVEVADALVGTPVLILDARATLRRANRAGRALLAEGAPFVLRDGRLALAAGDGTPALRAAVAAAARSAAGPGSALVALPDTGPDGPCAIALAPCAPDAEGAARVALLVPVPPGDGTLREAGRALGLSATEARLAVLLAAGLSNREGAARAGLKEQTFATYTKRILAKLGASCRAELAHRLTWLAAGMRP